MTTSLQEVFKIISPTHLVVCMSGGVCLDWEGMILPMSPPTTSPLDTDV